MKRLPIIRCSSIVRTVDPQEPARGEIYFTVHPQTIEAARAASVIARFVAQHLRDRAHEEEMFCGGLAADRSGNA